MAAISTIAQNPAPADKPLVRVNVDLVQIELIVTDSKGNHVAGLAPEDFEILESGKPQPITHFSFVSTAGGAASAPDTARLAKAGALPPARIEPGQATRTMAIVIDDLGLGDQSFAAVHAALENFVDTQIQPGDLAAIITTSGRLGSLQRLTGDRRLLRAAVNSLRSLPNHRPGVGDSDFTCAWYQHRRSGMTAGIQDEDAWLAANPCPICSRELDPAAELENDRRAAYYGRLSISAMSRVVDGLRNLPGRRSILLLTEGLPVVRGQGTGEPNSQVSEAYEAFLNHANRAGVAVNTIDPRGLIATFETAERGYVGGGGCAEARMAELTLTQLQLGDIAKRTGGISVVNNNDLAGSFARFAGDQLGYYLIGYKPPEGAGKRDKVEFRKIAVQITRPGLRARFHTNIYKEPAEPASGVANGNRLVAAVASPFTISNVHIRFASRFWDAGTDAGVVLDTTLQIEPRDLTFSTGADGRRKATFDVLALIYGPPHKLLDNFEKSYTVTLTDAAYERSLHEGLVQRLQLRLKQPGAYQVRGAVEDRASGRIGSASEFVEVPDLARGRLALSGVALSGAGDSSPNADRKADRLRFRPGDTVAYAYQVLNARAGAGGSFQVEARATLYRGGRALGSSPSLPVNTKGQPDPKRLAVTNEFRLGKQLPPGEYVLEIVVTDGNAPERQRSISQAATFEVVE